MCPGCVEWQNHLAAVVGRILRETGADGIRLDSLGFYFLPCYNPEHHHATPFGYNDWMKQLLAKVRAAAFAVNPNAYLTTEAPVDFYGRWFHGALTDPSRGTRKGTVVVREAPPMRLAVAPYRPIIWSPGGPVWASVMGLAGGGGSLDWVCAQAPVYDTLVWGDIAGEDPECTDPDIVTRRFTSRRCDVVVATRHEVDDGWWRLATRHALYEMRMPTDATVAPVVAVCDIEALKWNALQPDLRDGRLVISSQSNWVMVVMPHGNERVVQFDGVPDVHPGDEVVIRPETLVGSPEPAPIEVVAPGLRVGTSRRSTVRACTGDPVRIGVPKDALPGWYSIRIRGPRILGGRRLLHVLPAPTKERAR